MFGKYKLSKAQESIVDTLSKEVKMSKDDIVRLFVEMGISFMITWRKGKSDEGIKLMSKRMEEDPIVSRICQRLEAFYNAGR
jgi:phosphoribosylaminoimidazole (AIR) synthetase